MLCIGGLDTQDHSGPTGARDGWLAGQQWLYSRRAPGNTCLSSLRAADPERFGEPAANDSKGCGAVMRSAPFGLLGPTFSAEAAFQLASESAAYTHGHPTGQVASGALDHLIANLVAGSDLRRSVDVTVDFVAAHDPNGQTTRAEPPGRQHRLPVVDHFDGRGQLVGIDPDEHPRHELRLPAVVGWLTPGGHCYYELGRPLFSHTGTMPGGNADRS